MTDIRVAAPLLSAIEVANLLGISQSSWWQGVRDGLYPQPIKLGRRTTRWHSVAIERLINFGVNVQT